MAGGICGENNEMEKGENEMKFSTHRDKALIEAITQKPIDVVIAEKYPNGFHE